ncbi:hypothetical protein F4808DRAFT_405689 [Astrocystis sublimbata]|nr:hypothetical protein F4808DRAFT_405689 [Astrocystis sublimbata]
MQSPECRAPTHTGLVRDELVLCRHLFGPNRNPFNPQGQLGPALRNTPFRDVLLVSVHITGRADPQKGSGHAVGISVLDLRHLQSYIAAKNKASPHSKNKTSPHIIRSHQLQVSKSTRITDRAARFLFGNTERVDDKACVKSQFQKVIGNRSFVLVTYGGKREWEYVGQLGIRPLYHLDVLKVIQAPLQTSYRYSLAKLLTVLKLPWQDIHVAGNDARFTLHALLLAVVADWSRTPKSTPNQRERATLSSLKAVAKEWHLPEQEQPCLVALFRGHL